MEISIYGVGYVGLVTGVGFAKLGHDVLCMDIDAEKIKKLSQGIVPFYEEGLETLLHQQQQLKKIHFTTDAHEAALHGKVHFIAVGTPSNEDGSVNLNYVIDVSNNIGKYITASCFIVNKSTVPVGTANQVSKIINAQLKKRNINLEFEVLSNPEFLKEGSALHDFFHPDRIIVGSHHETSTQVLREIYQPLIHQGYPFITMDMASAELSKYATNAFLAMKISFINEMAELAEHNEANINSIKQALGSDSRINEKFLNAGCGFGGSCFPKDLLALKHLAETQGIHPFVINATLARNEYQQTLLFKKIKHYFNADLKNKTIAIWGLSFKPNTDDIRRASSCILMEKLWAHGAKIKAYDPLAMPAIASHYPQHPQLTLCESKESALINADALALVTEWSEFQNPDFKIIAQSLKTPVIFDGRNLYQHHSLQHYGIIYQGIGNSQ